MPSKKEFRTSWHPWNAGFAVPLNIREEDWHAAPIEGGLPGGWPYRDQDWKTANGYYRGAQGVTGSASPTPPASLAGCCGPCGQGLAGLPEGTSSIMLAAGAGVGAYIGLKHGKGVAWAAAGGFAGAWLATLLFK